MSRSIVIVGTGRAERSLADALGRALGRRVIADPSNHPDEVILIDASRQQELDLSLACVLAPAELDLEALLLWAMERGDVLTRSEHEDVMP